MVGIVIPKSNFVIRYSVIPKTNFVIRCSFIPLQKVTEVTVTLGLLNSFTQLLRYYVTMLLCYEAWLLHFCHTKCVFDM